MLAIHGYRKTVIDETLNIRLYGSFNVGECFLDGIPVIGNTEGWTKSCKSGFARTGLGIRLYDDAIVKDGRLHSIRSIAQLRGAEGRGRTVTE